MKPSLRMLRTVATAHRRGQVEPLDEAVTRWQVCPGDLDVFGHMNNSRYLQLMDYARLDLLIRMGLLPAVVKNRWIVPLGMAQVDFRAPLKPFQKFEIGTRVLSYDDRWVYIAQTFRSLDVPSRLVATGYVKTLFRSRSGPLPPKAVIRMALGKDIEAPELSDEMHPHFGLPPRAPLAPPPRQPKIASRSR
jgi:acyl-CoA thioesterase FadM